MYFTIQRAVMLQTWHNYNNNSIFFMCRQTITNNLMENGFSFERNNRVFVPPADVNDTINNHWLDLVSSIVDQVVAFGFVVVLVSSKNSNIPSVLDPHLFDIGVSIEDNVRTYTVTSSEVDVSDVVVYDMFGFHPVIVGNSGYLASVAWKVQPKLNYLENLRHACQKMETNKGQPQFFTELVETSRERQEGMDFDFYGEADSTETSETMQFARNKAQIEMLNKQKDLLNRHHGSVNASRKLNDVVQLPAGLKVVMTPQNTGRQDIVQVHKVIQEEVCSTLGIPRAMLIADGQFKSSTDGVEHFMQTTIAWWRARVETVLTDLYAKIYMKDIEVKNLNNRNIYKMKQRMQVFVKLEASVSVTPESLTLLYESGVIGWSDYCNHILQAHRLPLATRQPEPISDVTRSSNDVNAANVTAVSNKRKRTGGGADTPVVS